MDQRKKLLEAAITCLQERGYARTTTRDIVAEAGSHLPAINYYFGSKEHLLNKAIVEALHRWMETTMAVARDPSPADPAERLRASVERFLEGLEGDRAYVVAAIEAFAQATRSDDLRERLGDEYRLARGQVAANVAAAAGADRSPAESPDALNRAELDSIAAVLMALFDGLAIQWLLAPDSGPDTDQVMQGLQLLGTSVGSGEQ